MSERATRNRLRSAIEVLRTMLPVQPKPFRLSLFRRHPEPCADRQVWPAGREAAAADLDLTRLGRIQAVDEAQQFGATRANQPGQTEDLALAQRERGTS